MPSVSLLLIDDAVVAPHLQLIRYVCEPYSASTPHITVRYFERLGIPDDYKNVRVKHIDLIEPGIFEPHVSGPETVKQPYVVFVRCKSDDLAPLEHKPHFPGSDFHITIYEGPAGSFAQALSRELQRFRWGFRVPLDGQGLTVKHLSPLKRRKPSLEPSYKPELDDLFRGITSEELTPRYLARLTNRQRLKLCRAILKSLFRKTIGFERISSRKIRLPRRPSRYSETPDLPEVHLTPPELARGIAQYALSQMTNQNEPIHFGDPAVGTGAFFAALLQLAPNRIASAIGIDINAEQVAAARWRWADKGMLVRDGDYLHMDHLPPRTLILANPPYLRHQSIPSEYKRRLLERASTRTDIRVSSRSGLYVYFLLLSHDWMQEDATAAWLIPSEFMKSVYGAAVRRYLTEKVQLVRVHVYAEGAPQFENVDVLPALVVFRNRKPSTTTPAAFSSGGDLNNPDFAESIAVGDLQRADTWRIPFGSTNENATTTGRYRIGDLFTVKRGIATGANDFFIMTRERAKALGIPKRATRPLLPKVRALPSDIVQADAHGFPKLFPQLCVIDCIWTEEFICARYPRLMEYLNTAKSLGILNRRLLKDRHPWYKQEHREPPPFLCTYMGRGSNGSPPLRFIWNKSRAIATNTYLLLYPRPALARALRRVDARRQLFQTLQAAARSGILDQARVHAGGLFKIEPRELSSVFLDIPSPLNLGTEKQLTFFR